MVWCRWLLGVAAEMRWCEGGEFFARLGGSLCCFFCERFFVVRTRNAARVAVGCCGVQLEAAEVFCVALRGWGSLKCDVFVRADFWGAWEKLCS